MPSNVPDVRASTALDAGARSAPPDASRVPGRDAGPRDPRSAEVDAGADEVEASYDVSMPLEVSLELAQADWDKLRQEGRSLPATVSGCPDPTFQGYSKVSARLTLQNQVLENVELRKKGYIGSISISRPSLSVDFPQARTLAGFRRLTLNNDREDTTNAHQCMAYAFFRRAGLHAPRCGLARVRVNGADLGYYTLVEPIKKPFLRRDFAEDAGNLYELEAPTDLSVAQADRIELKSDGNDRTDLDRLLAAVNAPDSELIPALERVLDLDELVRFWAVEGLLGQWDGLSGHGTNAFLYHARRDDRFHPIAWGADQAFTSVQDVLGAGTISVMASTRLSRRLWALPEWRTKYQQRMRELLQTQWDEDALSAELQAIAQRTQATESAVAATERFIRAQRQLVEDELVQLASLEPRGIAVPGACDPAQPASAQLSFTWRAAARDPGELSSALSLLTSVQPVPPGQLELSLKIHDRTIMFAPGSVLSAAAVNTDRTVLLGTLGTDMTTRSSVLIGLTLPLDQLKVGDVKFHGYETYGVITEPTAQGQRLLGYLGQGSLHFDVVGPNDGDPIRGSFSGMVAAQPAAPQ